MEVAGGFRGRLHAVLWFAEEGHSRAVMDCSIVEVRPHSHRWFRLHPGWMDVRFLCSFRWTYQWLQIEIFNRMHTQEKHALRWPDIFMVLCSKTSVEQVESKKQRWHYSNFLSLLLLVVFWKICCSFKKFFHLYTLRLLDLWMHLVWFEWNRQAELNK